MTPTTHHLRSFLLPVELEEAFCAALWDSGVVGLETLTASDGRPGPVPGSDELRVDAYYPCPLPAEVALDLEDWTARGVRLAADGAVEPRDWLADYRARVEPFAVGRTWWIDSRDAFDSATSHHAERTVLRVPAQNAFGTGSHASTRLTLELLEDLALGGRDVLDVGTGSGILAFAALSRGARRVVGLDIDPPSVITARHNADLNRQQPAFLAGTLGAVGAGRFDLALVNVLPERIAADLPRLPRLLAPGGQLISSGNLLERRDELLGRFAGLGFEPVAERRAEEWVAWTLAVVPERR